MNLILHVTHPDIDLGVIRGTNPTPDWLSAITPLLDPMSDIRDGSMTLFADLKDFQTLTQLLKQHLPGAVILRRIAHRQTA